MLDQSLAHRAYFGFGISKRPPGALCPLIGKPVQGDYFFVHHSTPLSSRPRLYHTALIAQLPAATDALDQSGAQHFGDLRFAQRLSAAPGGDQRLGGGLG